VTENVDRLYELLPTYIRARDVERGYPLRALLRVIGHEVVGIEENIAMLYDDWFIETCQEWVVPYIGDLIGYEAVEDLRNVGSERSSARDRVLIPRREIANTLRYRARKGTLALLEALAMDVGGWTAAAAVEFFGNRVKYNGTVREIIGDSIFNPSVPPSDNQTHIRLYVWRKRVYPVTHTIPNYIETRQPNYYSFSPIGHDVALFTRPGKRDITANAQNLPVPITRERFEKQLADYYGEGKSICVYALEWPPTDEREDSTEALEYKPVDLQYIVPGILSDDVIRRGSRPTYPRVAPNQIVIDPALGRMLFPARPRQRTRQDFRVDYYTGFSADLGGGEYERPLSAHPDAKVIPTRCADFRVALQQAVALLKNQESDHVLVEINDSGVYSGSLPQIVLLQGQTLQIRAANRCRPVIWIQDNKTGAPDDLCVLPYPGSCFILDGIVLAGRGLYIEEPEDAVFKDMPHETHLIVRHSTLVPGWLLEPDTQPVKSEGSSIQLNNVLARLTIQRSIVGSIAVLQEDVKLVDPTEIVLEDSILDSTSARREPALYSYRDDLRVYPAYVALTVRRSTIIGEVDVQELPLAENSIFYGTLNVFNRQGGLMRYSYVPPNSNTPPRFRCEPDLHPDAEVIFLSQRYGTSDYGVLDEKEPDASKPKVKFVLEGGEFGAQMGVYYHLFNAVRRANLEKRLQEYLPLGTADAQVVYVT
jgi:hypothetical protein